MFSAKELRTLREKWVARATGRDVAAALAIDQLIRETFILRKQLRVAAKRHIQTATAPPAGDDEALRRIGQQARNSVVNLAFMSGEEAIQILTDMFGADQVRDIVLRQQEEPA